MQPQTKPLKFPIIADDTVTLSLEFVDGNPFVHCDVNKWSRETYRDLMEEWVIILASAKDEGHEFLYTCIPSDETKIQRFAEMFGFKPLAQSGTNLISYIQVGE